MAYVNPDYKTKKALKTAVEAGQHVQVFQPGLGVVPENGTVALEGPHYPQPHTWYATGVMEKGRLVKIQ